MLDKIIAYFAKRHILCNLIFVLVLVGGIFAWQETSKEELPSITFDTVRISVRYPGASAEDVEYFVTRQIEEELRGLDGIYRLISSSSIGQATITVELEKKLPNINEVTTEIRNAVLEVDYPEEVIDDPVVRVFKTSKKAILDIALIHKGAPILDVESRRKLQDYAHALENQLTSLPQIHSVDKTGYLQEEIQIKAYPEKLVRYEIPFNTVIRDIKDNHLRKPAGTLETRQEPKVTLVSELNLPEKLKEFIVQGGFEGKVIRLGEVAEIDWGHEKQEYVYKVNGYEAVMFNVVKNSNYGILDSIDAVTKGVEQFRKNNLARTDIELVLLDDESLDVRNRLNLVSVNGAIGFILILVSLFIFLDKRSGFWVAMGIPFTLCFTMIACAMIGYTINGTTLAAVIIVLGIVVDDAIVVSENISRLLQQGVERCKAVVQGTSFVLLPVIASIVTTCVAFIPLFFFTGHFAQTIEFIPPVIFFMLGSSLFESIFILPGHMGFHLPFFSRFSKLPKRHWFENVEDFYGRLLEKVLPFKWALFLIFILLLVLSGWIMTQKMSFVMFPNEETRDLVLTGKTPSHFTRYDTAKKVREIEDIFIPYIGKEVVGFRTDIGRSRRGGAIEENQFRVIIEIVAKEKRKKSADQLIAGFQEEIDKKEGFAKVVFRKSRWGQDSGSPIELQIHQNNNQLRSEIAKELAEEMRQNPALASVEIDEGLMVPEYRIRLNREKIKRLGINPADLASTFRAALEGTVLYEFTDVDEDIRVRLTTVDSAKNDIEKVLDIPVENKNNYLVPLRNIVTVEKGVSPNRIARFNLKRTTILYADIKKESRKTPLQIAQYYEEKVFPQILSRSPTTSFHFAGEVEDTRQSRRDLDKAIILVLLLIYFILAVLFGSLARPLIIMLAIPFGMVGIILAFYLHSKTLFGFYSAIGALGLAGVVINDSIVVLVKIEKEFKQKETLKESLKQIADLSKTRLRAVVLTTLTTVAGVLPTAYGFAGYDAMLAEMMLALVWGLIFGTLITLFLIPSIYSLGQDWHFLKKKIKGTLPDE